MKRTQKKVAVVGLGPVGSILAVHLKLSGLKTALCDIDLPKLQAIRNGGISLQGSIEKSSAFDFIFSTFDELQAFEPEIVFFAVKAHQMPRVLEDAAQLNNENITVVSAQNGIDVEEYLFDTFGENKTLRMVINYAGGLLEANRVNIAFFNPPNYIASIDDSHTEMAELVAGKLNHAGLATKAVTSFEIIKRAWEKTILNAALSPLCGIAKFTMKEAMESRNTLDLVEEIILESVQVAAQEKIFFEDEFVRKCLRYLKKGGHHFPSLALDLINKHDTEIDFMNGKIVEYGKKHYVRTPVNLAFTNMVRAISRHNLEKAKSEN